MAKSSHLKLAGVAAIGALALGCSGGEAGAPPGAAEAQPAVEEGESPPELGEFEIALTGEQIPMSARAELKVREGIDYVHVAITGRTPGTDVMVIDLTFDGIENVIGTHRVDFGLPDTGAHIANGSIGDTWYYSQAGEIEVSVSPDGVVTGSFEIQLAEGDETLPPGVLGFEPRSVTKPLVGSFTLAWTLICYSRLPGHSALVFGGEYCDNLEL